MRGQKKEALPVPAWAMNKKCQISNVVSSTPRLSGI